MIINVFDYSMTIRSDFFRSKKSIRYEFNVDFNNPDIKSLGRQNNFEPSGYFYACNKIDTLFVFFQKNNIIYLAQKNKNLCIIHNLSDLNFRIEKIEYFMRNLNKFIVESNQGEVLFEMAYRTNIADEWLVDTDLYENPDFFQWIQGNLGLYREHGITLPKYD